ncbi:MAG: dihydrodipicolinate synthase family protein [Phycisphaerae bacterium]|nr:dihydrodipicolinate synthase family protein [Phycisphaerae bacterium]
MSDLIRTPSGTIDLVPDRWKDLRQDVDSTSPLPRLCYAAAHVVMSPSYAGIPHSIDSPGSPEEIAEHLDWDATMAIRRRIGDTGMGIAEAMDTAQRFNLGWTAAKRLIELTGELRLASGFCAGAGTDHLASAETPSRIIEGVVEQIHVIRAAGGVPVILPMPRLCELGCGEDDYVEVYGDIAREAGAGPLIVHWLGPMFLASLEGYFPGDSFLRIMRNDPERYRAAKLSMLDHELEVRLRRDLLQRDQIMLTGDDFHFGALIAGETEGIAPVERTTRFDGRTVALGDFSHALLGIFDAIADPAALAMRRLALGDRSGYDRIMLPCERLGQEIFKEPTRFYKTGLAFLAWLDGRQANPMLVNHEEGKRSVERLLQTLRLADAAGSLKNPAVVAERIGRILDWRPPEGDPGSQGETPSPDLRGGTP